MRRRKILHFHRQRRKQVCSPLPLCQPVRYINGEPDHIHLFIEADPQTPPAELVNVIKTQTSRRARKLYGDTLLKKYYWKHYFWSDSYFIATVSENTLDVVKNYIKNQGIK